MLLLILVFLGLHFKKLARLEQEILFWGFWLLLIHALAFWGALNFVTALVIVVLMSSWRLYRGHWWSASELGQMLLYALPFLLISSMPNRFIDSGRYYNQTVRWFEMGLPRGLANFDLYLIQASAAHSWEALGNILSGTGQNELTTLLAAGLIARTLLELQPLPKIVSPLLLLVFGFWVHFSQAASPDLLLLAFTFTLLKAQKRSKLFLILLLPLLKLQGALIALFLVISFWKSTHFKKSLALLLLSAILAAAKLIWLAGWLPVVGSLHLPWSITDTAAAFISRSVTGHQGLNSGVYLSELLRLRWLDSLVMLAHLSSLMLLFFSLRQNSPTAAKSFALRHLFLFAIWFLLFPQGRYLLALWTLLFVDSAALLKHSLARLHTKPKLALVLCTGLLAALLPLWHLLPGNPRWQHFFGYSGFPNIAWIKPQPLWQVPTRRYKLPGSFHFHVPEGPQYCFDSAFPCREWPRAAYGTDSTALSQCFWVDNSYFSSQENPD